MKRIIAFLLSALLILSLAACGGTAAGAGAPGESAAAASSVQIRIAGLKGPTSMGLVKVMEDAESGAAAGNYAFSLFGSADEVTPKLIQGELDMAALPANLAAVLYNNTDGAIRVLAVNTLGVLDIVEKGSSVQSIADLKGRTIYATGKGSTPEYTIRHILSESGIDPDKDVTLEFRSEPTEVVSLLSAEGEAVAMLPQPYVTAALGKVEGLRIAIDLNEAWNALDTGSLLITGVMAARADFIEQNKAAVDAFLKEYEASVGWVIADPADAAALIEKFDIAKAAAAEKALPFCNLTFLAGSDMTAPLGGYLEVLYGQNPKAVGGKLPAENFYYTGK